jgi:hypothetical protein
LNIYHQIRNAHCRHALGAWLADLANVQKNGEADASPLVSLG